MNCATCEDNEIYKTLGWKRTFHELVMKPISYHFSSKILRREILKAMGDVDHKRIIDVSCGDDMLPVYLHKLGARVTCNDLCLDSMRSLFKYKGLTFTNKNLFNLRCKKNTILYFLKILSIISVPLNKSKYV